MSFGALSPTGPVITAIQKASAASGVDFTYLMTQAKAESGFDPDAKAATSSARGLYQFTGGTWLDTIRRHGAAAGFGRAAAAVADGSAARDPAVRREILDLRRDPAASAAMAAAYAADNAAKLANGLGRAASAADLYMAHFLGPTGALRFLKARDATPDLAAAAIAPGAARANHAVFFARSGAPRSLSAVYDRFAAKFGGNLVPPSGTRLPVAPLEIAAAPQAARTAYLRLAELSV